MKNVIVINNAQGESIVRSSWLTVDEAIQQNEELRKLLGLVGEYDYYDAVAKKLNDDFNTMLYATINTVICAEAQRCES